MLANLFTCKKKVIFLFIFLFFCSVNSFADYLYGEFYKPELGTAIQISTTELVGKNCRFYRHSDSAPFAICGTDPANPNPFYDNYTIPVGGSKDFIITSDVWLNGGSPYHVSVYVLGEDGPLSITSGVLFNVNVGDNFSYTVTTDGGTEPITKTLENLPSWLNINPDGFSCQGVVPAGLTQYTFTATAFDDDELVSEIVTLFVGNNDDDYEDDETWDEDDDLTGDEDSDGLDSDDDVPTLNQIKDAIRLQHKDLNKFRHKTYEQLEDIKELLTQIRDQQGGEGETGEHNIIKPTLEMEDKEFDPLPDHTEETSDEALSGAISNNASIQNIVNELTNIQNTPSGSYGYLTLPVSYLSDDLDDIQISFFENDTLNSIRLVIRGAFTVVIWAMGFYVCFVIMKPAFKPETYLG